jgi:hypothetical protein
MAPSLIRLSGGAGQEFKDELGFELGRKRTSLTTWHEEVSWLGPVFIMLLVQRQGRTTVIHQTIRLLILSPFQDSMSLRKEAPHSSPRLEDRGALSQDQKARY